MIYKRAGTTYADLNYSYDLLGRRVRLSGSLARAGVPQAVTTATYDAANQLTNWNGAAQSYDANGNLTSDGTNTYTWNARNQLSSMSGATTASFGYDAMNRRTQKTIAGVTTQFMYDGDNAVKEIKGGQNATLFGSGTDRFYSRTDSAGERVMLTDGLGSVLGLVDSAGTTTTSYTYDAFGGTSVSGTASDNANQYTSRENDGTGLYFYRARYYQPKVGRFISQDPARQAGSGHNWYAYTNNSPTNLTDPSGLKPRKDCGFVSSQQRWNAGTLFTIDWCLAREFADVLDHSAGEIAGMVHGHRVLGNLVELGTSYVFGHLKIGATLITVTKIIDVADASDYKDLLPSQWGAAYLNSASDHFRKTATAVRNCGLQRRMSSVWIPDYFILGINESTVECL